MKNTLYVAGLILIALFAGCASDTRDPKPNISAIPVDIHIQRFEKDLFAIDTNQVETGLTQLTQKYPVFANFYLDTIMGITRSGDPLPRRSEQLRGFLTFRPVRELYDTCMLAYKDISGIENDMSEAFRYYRYYFPKRPVPQLVSCVSEFSVGAFTYGDTLLGIGWDFFLGENYSRYDLNVFPKFIARTMNSNYITLRAMEALTDNIIGDPPGNRLLDMMVHNGKKMYIIDHLLPDLPDSVKLSYTQNQVNWCRDNEIPIWAHLLKDNLLYSSKQTDIRKLVTPSPNSPGMPPEAPGQTANYIGWKIVQSYMRKFPNTSFEQLIALRDAQKILELSKYKPDKER